MNKPRTDDAPAHHDLKSWPQHFEPVFRGDKVHEIRRADRDFQEGDTIRLREFLPDSARPSGRWVRAVITHVSHAGPIGTNARLPEGLTVFSFRVHAKGA